MQGPITSFAGMLSEQERTHIIDSLFYWFKHLDSGVAIYLLCK
jgi:hypothetical protein